MISSILFFWPQVFYPAGKRKSDFFVGFRRKTTFFAQSIESRDGEIIGFSDLQVFEDIIWIAADFDAFRISARRTTVVSRLGAIVNLYSLTGWLLSACQDRVAFPVSGGRCNLSRSKKTRTVTINMAITVTLSFDFIVSLIIQNYFWRASAWSAAECKVSKKIILDNTI
jgi:hypothetical protein